MTALRLGRPLLLLALTLLLLAAGQCVVIITRNVDLSVGSVLGISAFACGDYLTGGGNPVVAVLIGVAVGIVFGVLNGLLTAFGLAYAAATDTTQVPA